MSVPEPSGPANGQNARAKRRRKLVEDLEDALPDGTRDERSDAWGERGDTGQDDEWLRGEVPPHHG